MRYLKFENIDGAEQRSRELWEEKLGRPKKEEDESVVQQSTDLTIQKEDEDPCAEPKQGSEEEAESEQPKIPENCATAGLTDEDLEEGEDEPDEPK